ncbi:hypothetical protein AMTR_s00049p00169280 [Amborella trichopoda]|uniref:Uncharacterized protein n=1 Tax=Amborella trichopoda TaxID=13333 RepID=W1PUN7_AMBTC|nr:hypothetical protein AMTR_s00049p00169280 [Amborella trichopoda]
MPPNKVLYLHICDIPPETWGPDQLLPNFFIGLSNPDIFQSSNGIKPRVKELQGDNPKPKVHPQADTFSHIGHKVNAWYELHMPKEIPIHRPKADALASCLRTSCHR